MQPQSLMALTFLSSVEQTTRGHFTLYEFVFLAASSVHCTSACCTAAKLTASKCIVARAGGNKLPTEIEVLTATHKISYSRQPRLHELLTTPYHFSLTIIIYAPPSEEGMLQRSKQEP